MSSATSKLFAESTTKASPKSNSGSSKNKSATEALFSGGGASGLAYVPKEQQTYKEPEKKNTLGTRVKEFGKDVAKAIISPVATTVARPIQAVAQLAGASSEQVDAYTKSKLGDFVAPVPQNINDVVKDAGRSAQTVLLGVGGATLGAGKGLAATAGREALIGGAFGASAAVEKNGLQTTPEQLLKEGAIGAVTGAAIPVVGQAVKGIFKKGTSKVIEKAATEVPVPTPTVPKPVTPTEKLATYSKKQGYEPVVPNEQLPVIDAGKPLESDIPTIQIGDRKPAKVKGDFTYEPIPSKQPLENKGISANEKPISPVAKSKIESTTVTPETPVSKAKSTEYSKAIAKDDITGEFESGSYKKWADKISTLDDETINKIAQGGKNPFSDVPKNAFYSIAKNNAERLGDTELISKLADSSVGSKAGQELVASKLTTEDNIVDIVRDIKQTRIKEILQRTGKKSEVEIKKISEQVKQALDTVNEFKPTKQMIVDTLESLKCK